MKENDNQDTWDQNIRVQDKFEDKDILDTSLEETKKSINIVGVSNRYQIKKLTNKDDKNKIKFRKESQKWQFPQEVYERKYQFELLHKIYIADNLHDDSCDNHDIKLMKRQIEKKINNYKQQDINKNMYDSNNIITLEETISKLKESHLLCYYCNKEMFILYEIVRESFQWTLDRIDNSFGHNKNNVIIACLQCNLKRRKQSKDAFLFTKQLQIVKKS
jgi:hypothetical protein